MTSTARHFAAHLRSAAPYLLLAALAVLALTAIADGKGSDSVTLCARGADGQLRLARGGKCDGGARKIVIRKSGRQGPTGAQGAQGPQGASGPDASAAVAQPEPVKSVTGPASGTCVLTPGVFCSDNDDQPKSWSNVAGPSFAKAGYRRASNGLIYLQGLVTLDNPGAYGASVSTIFHLPPGYRPSTAQSFPVAACDGVIRYVYAYPDGAVQTSNLNCHPVSLDGVRFHP